MATPIEGEPNPASAKEKAEGSGENVAPDVMEATEEALGNAKSLAVICGDPDAPSGTFTHWIVYDIPSTVTKFDEGASGGGTEGVNSFGKVGYAGCSSGPGSVPRLLLRSHHRATAPQRPAPGVTMRAPFDI